MHWVIDFPHVYSQRPFVLRRDTRRVIRPASAIVTLLFGALAAGAVLAQHWADTIEAACFNDTCIALGVSSAMHDQLKSDAGADAEAFAAAVEYWFRHTAGANGRLVTARYRNGRLVRYATSDPIALQSASAAAALPEAGDSVSRALRPVAEAAVALRAVSDGFPVLSVPVALDAFTGHLPPTFLAGTGDGSLLAPGAEDMLDDHRQGDYGVIALIPESTDLRDTDRVQSFGLLVRLESLRR